MAAVFRSKGQAGRGKPRCGATLSLPALLCSSEGLSAQSPAPSRHRSDLGCRLGVGSGTRGWNTRLFQKGATPRGAAGRSQWEIIACK